ncbi:MAG: thioredoxin family protein [Planctomycetota bacterium]|nr:thioredoxin family protein [Planctomycetota bacterium]
MIFFLAQCPCSGGDGGGGSGVHPLLLLFFLVGLWWSGRLVRQIWKKKGDSTMNKIGKISVVVVLLSAVGIVIALKRDGSAPTDQTDQTATNGARTTLPTTPLPRLVDIGAGKCIPCKMMAPILDDLKKEYAGRLQVDVFDTDKDPTVGEKYGIRIIPTQIFYDASGKELFRHEGFMSKEDILAKWKELGVDLSGKAGESPEPLLPIGESADDDGEATTTPTTSPTTKPAATISETYPTLASGALTHAKLVDTPEGAVLRAGELVISQADIDTEIAKAPANLREQLKKNAFFILEQMATGKLLLSEATRELKKAGKNISGKNEQDIIGEYFGILTQKLEVADSEIKEFYDKNKDLVGTASLDQVKPQIEQYLLGEKKQKFADGHVKALGRRIPIEVSAFWIKIQAASARDNPVDKVRDSGKPSLVDFGSEGCRPCDMLAPILETLKKKYEGKANVLFVSVRKEQILAARYGIRSIPVQIFFDKDGKEVFRHSGFWPQEELEKKLAAMGVKQP